MDRIESPLNERSRRTRAAILTATWEVLEDEGGRAVSLAEVARRAGVSRRAIYLHFGSRSELITALHEHVDEVLDLQASIEPVLNARDAVTTLDEFAGHLARYHPKILAIDRAVVHGRRFDPDLAELYERGLAVWRSGCVAIAQRLADEAKLAAPWTVETAGDMLLALMRDEVVETLVVERGWTEEQHRTLLATLFRRTFVRSY